MQLLKPETHENYQEQPCRIFLKEIEIKRRRKGVFIKFAAVTFEFLSFKIHQL